jgi:hypothetical protein
MGRRSDLQLYAQAVNNGWPMSSDVRKAIIDECLQMVQAPGSKPREKVRAMEVLAKFDMLNFQRESTKSAKVNVNVSVPYEQMSADENDEIVDALVTSVRDGALEPPQEDGGPD